MITLARPEEVPLYRADGWRDQGRSRKFTNYHVMHMIPFDPPFVPDEETEHLSGAVASLGEES